jgi:hypothetical protein
VGLFMVGVPKKGKRTLEFLWGYFLQIKFTWNKFDKIWIVQFKIKRPCGSGQFLYSYVIVYIHILVYK